jgi:hypothetical protein
VLKQRGGRAGGSGTGSSSTSAKRPASRSARSRSISPRSKPVASRSAFAALSSSRTPGQRGLIPPSKLPQPVVGQGEELGVRGVQVEEPDRDVSESELLRGQQPRVPGDDLPVLLPGEDGRAKPETFDGVGHSVHRVCVHARVLRPGNELGHRNPYRCRFDYSLFDRGPHVCPITHSAFHSMLLATEREVFLGHRWTKFRFTCVGTALD